MEIRNVPPNITGRQPHAISNRTPLDREMKEAAEETQEPADNIYDFCPAHYNYKNNKVTPLIDGPAIFKAAKKMVDKAEDTIMLEMYDLNDIKMVQSLVKAAKRGVDVKILLDPSVNDIQSDKRGRINEVLKESGVDIVEFKNDSNQSDHVKLLVVDGKRAMLGGMNWNSYSRNNHDANVMIKGDAVNYYKSHFIEGWNYSGGEPIELPDGPVDIKGTPSKNGNATVRGVRTMGRKDRSYKVFAREAIQTAKKSVYAQMYVLSSEDVINDLIDAKERGVDVRVILDPHNAYTGWSPNGKTFDKLKEAGVPVRWFKVEPTQRMHAKWTVIDGQETLIGSGNFSHKGFNINREIGADVVDPKTSNVFQDQFYYDWRYKASEEYPL